MIAESDSNPRESAIFAESADGVASLRRSTKRASPSRTAAYWLIVAKIPVMAATPRVRYFAESAAAMSVLSRSHGQRGQFSQAQMWKLAWVKAYDGLDD